MLRRLALRHFVIVAELELEFGPGFTVLTGETGAGKSILVDALQLALGGRGDALAVREGAQRAEISAEFDAPASLAHWLHAAGFDHADNPGTLLLRRVIDTQGRSRAWINGSAATVAQLREAADHLVDIHGQHAWQGLTRAAPARALLDGRAGVDTLGLHAAWQAWRQALAALQATQQRSGELQRERDRLDWQLTELDKLNPGDNEWAELNAEHQRLAHAQSLIDSTRQSLDALDGDDAGAGARLSRALDALQTVLPYDARLADPADLLRQAQAHMHEAVRSLHSYLGQAEADPQRLDTLDARLSAWVQLARRWRQPPSELAALRARWQAERDAVDAAADLAALQIEADAAQAALDAQAARASALRAAEAPRLSAAVTEVMQTLGMAGGRFEVALQPIDAVQAYGREAVELRVAGHAGATPRALGKVASGGELSRLALAVAVAQLQNTLQSPVDRALAADGTATAAVAADPATLVFDEIDAGIGGAVADTVGRLMKSLGCSRQVLAVTHLAQVAACADHHHVVAKTVRDGVPHSSMAAVQGEARVGEIARMLGGERLSGAGRAHAQAMLSDGAAAPTGSRP